MLINKILFAEINVFMIDTFMIITFSQIEQSHRTKWMSYKKCLLNCVV